MLLTGSSLVISFCSFILKLNGIENILIKVIIHSIALSLKTILMLKKFINDIQFNPLIMIPDTIVAKDQVAALSDKA